MFLKENWHKFISFTICSIVVLFANTVQAKKLTIIYIPLDDRPVCNAYVQQTMEATGCKLILPPTKYLASHTEQGNPDKIWEWLSKKAPKADAAVISTDSLIYGGLVASRTHQLSESQLEARVKRLADLKHSLPIKLYAFSTVMRTPRSSNGLVEPLYYSKIGPAIFTYSQLLDKLDQGKLSIMEQLTFQALERNLMKAELGDWLERRKKNFNTNLALTYLSRNGKFHYLAIGKDDNAPLSATHMEARNLNRSTFDMSIDDYQLLDGVDQLGLLLLTRAYNELHGTTPNVYALYSEGVGQATLPQYSDSRLQDSVPSQIIAAGANIAPSFAAADLVLALNTPVDGIVKDSTADDNKFFANQANKNFINVIALALAEGHKVSLADISYSNGADNGFMHTLSKSIKLDKLAAYNGWNTADNAIGYAISQGILAKDMNEKDRLRLLRQRLIDDWFYQSNARFKISSALEKHKREDLKYALGNAEKTILKSVTVDCKNLAKRYTITKDSKFSLSFPWHRLFEVNIEIPQK